MIEARKIYKSYGPNTVLNGACLTVPAGTCVVLTGDNGSGKTTLLHVMVGLRHAEQGQVIWKDRLLADGRWRAWQHARQHWAFLPQQITLPSVAPVDRLLRFYARLRGVGLQPAKNWLERVGLEGTLHRRVDELSGGMRQRLGIALSLFFEPDLIVMDEPASSLDPFWRRALIGWIHEQAQRGAAVLITSQLENAWPNNVRHLRCVAGRVVDEAIDGAEGAA